MHPHLHTCARTHTPAAAAGHILSMKSWTRLCCAGPDVAVRCCPLLAITTPVGDSCRLALSPCVYTLFPAYCTSAPWLGKRAMGRVELVTARSLNTPSNGCGWQPLLWCLQRPSLGRKLLKRIHFIYLSVRPFISFFLDPLKKFRCTIDVHEVVDLPLPPTHISTTLLRFHFIHSSHEGYGEILTIRNQQFTHIKIEYTYTEKKVNTKLCYSREKKPKEVLYAFWKNKCTQYSTRKAMSTYL